MAGQQAVPSAQVLAPYAKPHLGRALLDLATSVVPYFALSVLMYLSLDVSLLLTLAIAIPAAAFLLRTFILFHDCTHGAFVPTRRANTWLGIALGVVVFSPFHSLALQPRGPSRHRRRPRPPRDRRRAHPDRRGVQRDARARAPRSTACSATRS